MGQLVPLRLGLDVHVVFVSIMRAPQKEPMWRQLDEANNLIAGYCADTPNTRYVDVNTVLFDANTVGGAVQVQSSCDPFVSMLCLMAEKNCSSTHIQL
jgi:hypothetical protein